MLHGRERCMLAVCLQPQHLLLGCWNIALNPYIDHLEFPPHFSARDAGLLLTLEAHGGVEWTLCLREVLTCFDCTTLRRGHSEGRRDCWQVLSLTRAGRYFPMKVEQSSDTPRQWIALGRRPAPVIRHGRDWSLLET